MAKLVERRPFFSWMVLPSDFYIYILYESVSVEGTLHQTPPKVWQIWGHPLNPSCKSRFTLNTTIMKLSLVVAQCYATKKEDAKYAHILHLTTSRKIAVKDAEGAVLGYDDEVVYLHKGSNFPLEIGGTMVLDTADYGVKSFDEEWVDDAGEARTSVKHWITPKGASSL